MIQLTAEYVLTLVSRPVSATADRLIVHGLAIDGTGQWFPIVRSEWPADAWPPVAGDRVRVGRLPVALVGRAYRG